MTNAGSECLYVEQWEIRIEPAGDAGELTESPRGEYYVPLSQRHVDSPLSLVVRTRDEMTVFSSSGRLRL